MIHMIEAKLAPKRVASALRNPRQLRTLIAMIRHCYTRSNGVNVLCSQIRHQVESVQPRFVSERVPDAEDYFEKADMSPREYIRMSLKLRASMRDGTVDSDDTLTGDEVLEASTPSKGAEQLATIETDIRNSYDDSMTFEEDLDDLTSGFFPEQLSSTVLDDEYSGGVACDVGSSWNTKQYASSS